MSTVHKVRLMFWWCFLRSQKGFLLYVRTVLRLSGFPLNKTTESRDTLKYPNAEWIILSGTITGWHEMAARPQLKRCQTIFFYFNFTDKEENQKSFSDFSWSVLLHQEINRNFKAPKACSCRSSLYYYGTAKVVYLLTSYSTGANEINHWVNSNPSFADSPKLCCHILLQQFIQDDSFILLRLKF